MTKKTERIQSPLARARGLGSAHHGVRHWMHQRITALALIPLSIWLVWSILSLRGVPHMEFIAWLSQPLHAVLMIFFVIAAFYHTALGMQVIIEDYVHCKCAKMASLIGLNLFFLGGALACLYAILRIAL